MDPETPSETDTLAGTTPPEQVKYPNPFIVTPTTPHTHTIILLHGRGSNGPKFGTEFITSPTSTGATLQTTLPFAKWIFPTAKKRRAVLFKRIPINQWFDIYDINNQSYREHLQVDGLQETTELVHTLIEEEIRSGIPAERIVVGGLSQGCAASLYAMLCYKRRIGGYIGMCGWLPFAKYVEGCLGISLSEGDPGDDMFETLDDEESPGFFEKSDESNGNEGERAKNPTMEAIGFLKDNISFPISDDDRLEVLQTPVFLGHGALDEKVQFRLGEQARDALKGLGFKVTWEGYDDLGHWYKIPEEIDHIKEFLTNTLGIQSSD
ncbi:hypothetical protein TWF481_000193 [Arthrobotrys musiformis]|uniref:Acyl-protein thioesterase 1 n=1 Tax=Arthrobotrys musiformis TaxID=47236 RepID=A0AAV9WNW0_9PEZI